MMKFRKIGEARSGICITREFSSLAQ